MTMKSYVFRRGLADALKGTLSTYVSYIHCCFFLQANSYLSILQDDTIPSFAVRKNDPYKVCSALLRPRLNILAHPTEWVVY
jgi:hypothetical protein